jgi:hypothetical protein
MEMERYEIQVLLRHHWKQKYKAAAAAKEISDVEGDGSVNEHTEQRGLNSLRVAI